jgi:periplasmic divalent cation tolerance protein
VLRSIGCLGINAETLTCMTDFIQITTTTGKRQDAEQIASELVSRRLAGCVQVSGPIVSTFRWQGKVETAEEWMCVIKTSRTQLTAIRTAFEEIHPYEVPELIATPSVDGSEAYLKWLAEQLGG